ncbi:MAG: thymidine phosphorylase [Kiritimatiellia bacterium]
MKPFVPQWIIEAKRDGKTIPESDLREFVNRFTDGSLPEYQMAAFAMAVYFQGMSGEEKHVLTDAMMHSGDTLSWNTLDRPTADKHSTGGIGDKISIPLAPLVAACGVAVPMISGRGLGITGGTLDKLDSIPGYRTSLSVDAFRKVLETVGCSIIGQTDRLAPADRKLYALRDVTGTVPSIPLITASILSKKLAEGAETLVFDVKYGSGAFMKTLDQAHTLADSLVDGARRAGRKATAILHDMNQPIGQCIGNALEIRESIEILQGAGPADTRSLVLELAVPMLTLSGVATDEADARRKLTDALESGTALETFAKMVVAQGGNGKVAEKPAEILPAASYIADVVAPAETADKPHVASIDAETIGRIVLLLGGGRQIASDAIDYAVGIDRLASAGASVSPGDLLLRLHARSLEEAEALIPMAQSAFRFR